MTTLQHPVRVSGVPGSSRPVGRRMRRIGLGAFFVSVAVNAALGIYAVLAPDFGETQGKILGTSLCVTAAVLLALACEPAWERTLLGPVPYLGAALGAIGFGLVIAAMWIEPESDVYGNVTSSTLTVAGACVAASLLVLARLAAHHQWVLRVTLALLALGAALLAIRPWLGDEPGGPYMRVMGVTLIALAAFAVSVPVLHWVDRSAVALLATSAAIRHCPYCGSAVTGDLEVEITCGRCGREFTVTAREPHSST